MLLVALLKKNPLSIKKPISVNRHKLLWKVLLELLFLNETDWTKGMLTGVLLVSSAHWCCWMGKSHVSKEENCLHPWQGVALKPKSRLLNGWETCLPVLIHVSEFFLFFSIRQLEGVTLWYLELDFVVPHPAHVWSFFFFPFKNIS